MTGRTRNAASEARGAVKSADRVLDLFELLAGPGREMSHAEIAEALAIPKSSLSELLATLQARGYIEFMHEQRSWRLGDQLLRLADAQSEPPDLRALALPLLHSLTEAGQESSALNLLDGDDAVVAASVMGPLRLVSHMRENDRAPLYATSGGKVLLAFMAREARDAYLARTRVVRITPNTLGSTAALRRALQQVQREGVAYSVEEFTPGIVGIAVPVMRPREPVLASINVALPAVRFNDAVRDRLGGLLRDTAAQLLARLER